MFKLVGEYVVMSGASSQNGAESRFFFFSFPPMNIVYLLLYIATVGTLYVRFDVF
jgi:hypothetical protein